MRHRPDYPQEIITLLQLEAALTPQSVIADVGSGTGISAMKTSTPQCSVRSSAAPMPRTPLPMGSALISTGSKVACSPAPTPPLQASHAIEMITELRRIYDAHQVAGQVCFEYDTRVHLGH